MRKTCCRCQKEKDISEFHKHSYSKDGYRPVCKECRKPESKAYCISHNRHIKAYRNRNHQHIAEYNKTYYQSNAAYFSSYRSVHAKHYQQWRRNNRTKLNAYRRHLKATDPNFKIACNLRSRTSTLLRRCKATKAFSTLKLLGCSLEQLKQHLEQQFQQGMSWDNYGRWHIDHIRPCVSFDLTQPQQQAECFHYSNLQPLWAVENLRKNDQIPN